MKASRTLLTIALSALITAAAVTIVSNGTETAQAQAGPGSVPFQKVRKLTLQANIAGGICTQFGVPAGKTLTIHSFGAEVFPLSATGKVPIVQLLVQQTTPPAINVRHSVSRSR